MKAAMIKKYGAAEVIQIKEGMNIPKLGRSDVMVRTISCGIGAGDIEVRKGEYKMLTPLGKKNRETLLGLEFSGVISAMGSGVKSFKIGAEVYGSTHVFKGSKANAEYVSVPATFIVPKPTNITHEEASSLPIGMITSIRALRDIAKLKDGQTILINGASGAVGMYAIQLAKVLGAKITTVSSQKNFRFVQTFAVDSMLDYRTEDFTKLDRHFDVVGNSTFNACKKVLKNGGIYISSNPQKDILGFVLSLFSSKKAGYLMAIQGSNKDLNYTNKLIEQGQIKPIVDKKFPFSKIIEAHKYFEDNTTFGKVILDMRN